MGRSNKPFSKRASAFPVQSKRIFLMKKLVIAAVASTAFISSAAFAQSNTDSDQFVVSGTVNQECSIGNVALFSFDAIEINQGAGANALLLVNGSEEAGAPQDIYVSCNYAAKMSAASANGGMLNTLGSGGVDAATLVANDPADFTNLIEYRVLLTATDTSFTPLDFRTGSNGGNGPVTTSGAFHNLAKLRVYLDRDDTSKRPVAGDYTDTATLTLGPV